MLSKASLSAGRDRKNPAFDINVNRFYSRAAVIAAAFLLIQTPIAWADSAVQVVEKLQSELLSVMKDAGTLGYTGRYEKLVKVIPQVYDFPFISRIVVGRCWRTFSEDEKKKFLNLFKKLSVATYADRFDGYSGERFNIVSTNESRQGRMVVQTVLIPPSGEKVAMTYVLHKQNNAWKIINVIVDGVSDLSLKRADYAAFLKNNDPKALLDELSAKISKFSDQDPTR